ncbi:ABC transporter permease [Boudabousia liubingyangii]|uniref:ABC transporter permease n=1 Tax=Boudabousia liubingyangii TaxID=1921764 RepID=UPI00093FC5DD|nr:ABC transporter permease [Boudabousia liubingyangii]OKL46314.1 ABC transporter permease [Boudabousia liubingyangii]
MSRNETALKKAPVEEQIKLPMPVRNPIVISVFAALLVAMAIGAKGNSIFSFEGATSWFSIPNVSLPASITLWVLTVLTIALAVWAWIQANARKSPPAWMLGVSGFAFVFGFLVWTVADKPSSVMPTVSLLIGGLTLAVPLIFGALSGVVCERSGVINIAIEGQLLFGAFMGAVVASATSSPYVGLIGSLVGGALVGVLLALFTVHFRADHIVVGVVLNMLVLGLTSFLYSTVLTHSAEYNRAVPLKPIGIPILKDIPIIGPIMFNQSILVYLVYVAVIGLQFALFRTRWGLRTRACGEHPKAADTVGVKVNRLRWINVIAASALAGLGGAFFTLGQNLAFSKEMTAGNGFIALAAMIIGRWNPKGALAAALLFGFATNLASVMQSVGSPLPAEYMLMLPYVVTILAVAGFVGSVRAPAAEGKPYPA